MLHSAHAPASSLQFVDGQELLSALLNSSPLFHLASCLHGLTSNFTGCVFLVFWRFVCCLFGGFVVVSLPVGCNLVCSSILTRLRDLCRTCAHSASLAQKKIQGETLQGGSSSHQCSQRGGRQSLFMQHQCSDMLKWRRGSSTLVLLPGKAANSLQIGKLPTFGHQP